MKNFPESSELFLHHTETSFLPSLRFNAHKIAFFLFPFAKGKSRFFPVCY